jgi:hypothetical protein
MPVLPSQKRCSAWETSCSISTMGRFNIASFHGTARQEGALDVGGVRHQDGASKLSLELPNTIA